MSSEKNVFEFFYLNKALVYTDVINERKFLQKKPTHSIFDHTPPNTFLYRPSV